MKTSLQASALWLAAAVCATTAGPAQGQDYPSKSITVVVPYAAGGPTDSTARRLADSLTGLLKVPVVVENKPGAATNLAAAYVAKAPKDGYTLLLAPGTMTSVNPYIYRSLSYKPEDFAPISLVSKQAFVLAASKSLPATNLAEFITYAKSRPEGVTLGHVGTGSVTHIVGEWIARALGFKVVGVPYKGSSQSTIDLIGGRIDVQIEGITSAVPLHQSGKERILASMGEERANLPGGVPTFREAGFPDLVGYAYFGLMAPAGTPDAALAKLHAAVVAAVNTPEFSERLAASGELAATSASPQQYSAHLNREYERWGRVLKPLNLQLD